MALTKPPVLPPWAEAGDKVQPTNAEIQTGWPLSNTPPARQRWNWILNFLANGVRYLTRRGLSDYGADETYMVGDRVIGDDGKTYRSIQDNNINHAPSASPLWWERWGYSKSELASELNNHDYKDSCRVATTANLAALSGLLTIDGVVLVAGDRVLVKDQATGSQNGIYVAAAGAWSRASDADENAEVTGGLIVPVVEGGANGDSLWMLANDGTVTIGATSLVFKAVSQTTTGVTQPQFDNSTNLATTAFVKRQGVQFAGDVGYTASTILTATDVGKRVNYNNNAAGTFTLPLLSAVPDGAAILITVTNPAGSLSVVPQGADPLNAGTSAVASIALGPGDNLLLEKSAATWQAVGGSAQLKYAAAAKQIAKAWCNFDGTQSGTITPRASHNVSSVTKNGTGDYTVNFTNAMTDANYSIQTSFGGDNSTAYFSINTSITAPTTTSCRVRSGTVTSAGVDAVRSNITIHGN